MSDLTKDAQQSTEQDSVIHVSFLVSVCACMCVCVQAYVVEDNKQLILEGQLHVALQTIGKEASSLIPREVKYASVFVDHVIPNKKQTNKKTKQMHLPLQIVSC